MYGVCVCLCVYMCMCGLFVYVLLLRCSSNFLKIDDANRNYDNMSVVTTTMIMLTMMRFISECEPQHTQVVQAVLNSNIHTMGHLYPRIFNT